MRLDNLSLDNFRNYEAAEVAFSPSGLIVVTGKNGQGKTNLLEAISYSASGASFRTRSTESMVRTGCSAAYVRSTAHHDERELLVESEIQFGARNRTLVNRNPVKESRKLAEVIPLTSFSPDDLDLVKGVPSNRRTFVDTLLANTDERLRTRQREFERILKQRNTLLKQAGGRLSEEISLSLDVWDDRLATASEEVTDARVELVKVLTPVMRLAYRDISGTPLEISASISTDWRADDGGSGMRATLEESRKEDLARGITTRGPHRDDVTLTIGGLSARSHASQGEQRTLAVAAKLAGHRHLTGLHGSAPILLLDDVFSELDPERTERLIGSLPEGQCFVATATPLPLASTAEQHISIEHGKIIS